MRIAAAKLARKTIDSLMQVDPEQGVIFMGDLNDDPQDLSLTEGMGAKHKIADVKKGDWVHCHNVLDITDQLSQEYMKNYRARGKH